MERYRKYYDMNYSYMDKNKEATPVAIINMLQDTAIGHSEAVGLSIDKLKEDGIGWVLNRWSVHMDSPLRWNTRVSVETWPCSFNRFYATREFLIRDDRDNILVRASSRWILINIEKKRPVRIPEEFGTLYGMEQGVRAVPSEFEDIGLPVSEVPGIPFRIRRSDLDTNHHVNNAKYIEWMIETIPDDIYDGYTLKSIEVGYIKEAQSGMIECITSEIKGPPGAEPSNSYIWKGSHLVRLINESGGTDLAIASSVWQKN
jgi:acyl-ACP thioesterase